MTTVISQEALYRRKTCLPEVSLWNGFLREPSRGVDATIPNAAALELGSALPIADTIAP